VRVALTGGLGSGKSTVAALLAERGAIVIDADELARDVVRAGTAGFGAVVDRFGPGVVSADGELDRAALASLVFADDAARADLNAIVHPLVAARSRELSAQAPPDAVVVYDIPLLVEAARADEFDLVVVVEASEPARLRRLEDRGVALPDARARMAAQASDAQRRAVADVVIDNNADRQALARQVAELWDRVSG
jgi:dephospho-CoA kinase